MTPGRVLGGRCLTGKVIRRGGMADVRVGRDLQTGRSVAIKALRTTLAEDRLMRCHLRREAQVLGRLRHHAVVALLDTGADEDGAGSAGTRGAPYLVLEHVAGSSLLELLRTGGSRYEKALRYRQGLLAGLEASHRAGIVHRHVEPANVMVTPTGAVKLVDFGIAGASGDPTASLTHAQGHARPPAYCSPEQARGQTTDARSDLSSARCLLFELLTGRPPCPGDDPVPVAYQHVQDPAPQADTGAPALDAVISKSLGKDRAERFRSAQAFRAALRSVGEARRTTTSLTRPDLAEHASTAVA